MRSSKGLFARLWGIVVRFWQVMSRPSRYFSLGFLILGGFLCGVFFWGGFNTAASPVTRCATTSIRS